MSSMVAKACSSASTQMPVLTAQEKGSRNKRKYRGDPPLANPDKIIPLPQTDQFEALATHDHTNGCDLCCIGQENNADGLKINLGLLPPGTSQPTIEELATSSGEFYDVDWSDRTESQLKELLLSNLDSIFKSAIKKIVKRGYSEEVAIRAILRTSPWYGWKDMVSNIVENTLTVLNSAQDIVSPWQHYFEDLKHMEKCVLAELIWLVREIRPFFSTGDAMWYLLMGDMSVSNACAVDSDSLGSFFYSDASNGNSNFSGQHRPLGTEFGSSSHPNTMFPCLPNTPLVTYARRSEISNVNPAISGHKFKAREHMNPQVSSMFGGLTQEKEGNSLANGVSVKPFNATGLSHPAAQEKLAGSSRKPIGITKRDYILRQKSLHSEKHHHRTHGSKGAYRSGKLSNFGGLVMDKELKGVSDSSGPSTKNPPAVITNAVPFDAPQEKVSGNGVSLKPTTNQESSGDGNLSSANHRITSSLPLTPVNAVPSLPAADTELSLSFPSEIFANPMPISINAGVANFSSGSIVPSKDKSQGTTTWAPHNRPDEIIEKLAPRVQELQSQLQEWTEWANQKVMQAARRLNKEKDELKSLRLDKEEAERLRKEQQTSKENNLKKLLETEDALRKAKGQVQGARAAVRTLETENFSLRRELEAATSHAAESAKGCKKLAKREKTMLASLQSSERQKGIFEAVLLAEKWKDMSLRDVLQRAKDARDQAEGKLHKEGEAKGELLKQVDAVRKEREQIEASAKSKEDSMKILAETRRLVYKNDMMKVKKEISQLRFKKDSSKIAALKRGIDGSKVQETKTLKKGSTVSNISKTTDMSSVGGVSRDRECVMCLTEEMSVVFLPCAHQVVCTACNVLHEKKGMRDCPTCRTPIRQRVAVRYSR